MARRKEAGLSLRGGRPSARRARDVVPRLRPTMGRVRRAVFDLLGAAVSDADVLDLFAGTGALGIEALARGARSATFVERDLRHAGRLRAACARHGEAASVLCADFRAALERFAGGGRRFGVVFVDPPYGRGMAEESLRRIAALDILGPGGTVVCEHGRREEPPAHVDGGTGLDRAKMRRYGDTCVSLFRRAGGEAR